VVTEGDDLRFHPETIRIKVGGQVRWTNASSTPHNVTFDTFPPSNTLNPGEDYELRFTVAGTFHYVCTFHAPGMVGTVVVGR